MYESLSRVILLLISSQVAVANPDGAIDTVRSAPLGGSERVTQN